MTSKQTAHSTADPTHPDVGHLHELAQLQVEGPEAMAFLQRQCMSDLRLLDADGSLQWSGLLSAKGRLLFLLRILRMSSDCFRLFAFDCATDALEAELRRFVFRSKLTLRAVQTPLRAAISSEPPTPGNWLAWDAERWIAADLPDSDDSQQAFDGAALDLPWQHFDTLRGIPRIGEPLRDRFTPQMLSLQSLRAFSLNKGCYPGQEIVARTHYLGQQKRELAAIEAERPLSVSDKLAFEGHDAGSMIQISRMDPHFGLAVVTRDPAAQVYLVEGVGAARRLSTALQG